MKNLISDIPWPWLILWGIISILLTVWLYRKNSWLKNASRSLKYSLIALRFSGLALIGLLLLGILFHSVAFRKEKPLFVTIIDESSSMKNYADSSQVANSIEQIRTNIRSKFGDKFEFSDYNLTGQSITDSTVRFQDKNTDLSTTLNEIREKYNKRNLGGILFISDGNFNEGQNPIYTAEKLDLTPVFTIGVGDTIRKKDVLIRNVISNDFAFLGNKFPIDVDIESNKISAGQATVTISEKGKVIGSKQINFTDQDFELAHLTFTLDAKSVGFHEYTVSVSQMPNEYSYSNNIKSVYVEVLDSRSKILLTSGAPHPDLGAIKSALSTDQNIEVTAKLMKDLPQNLSAYDLIVWHEPGVGTSAAQVKRLEDSGKPIWYFVGPNTRSEVVNQLNIGITTRTNSSFDDTRATYNSSFSTFEVSDEIKEAFSYFPPLRTRYGNMKIGSDVNTFAFQRLGNVQKKEPLIYFSTKNKKKICVTYGEGIWRWRMAEYAKNQTNKTFNDLVNKIAQYLIVKQNASALRVNLPKQFLENNEVNLTAEFYNDAMQLVTTPKIVYELVDSEGKKRNFDFSPRGNQYYLNIGSLEPGNYTWIASTNVNGKKYSKTGAFVVRKVELESLDTRANHNVLYQMAEISNGKFMTLAQSQSMLQEIEQRDDIVSISYESSEYKDLIDYKWLFFLIVLLFGVEWFLRRYNGAY